MINIFEALFILALDDDEGDIAKSMVSTLESNLAGALLSELVLQNRINITNDRVVVTDPSPTEHPILDKALFEISNTSRPRKLRYWINNLTYKKFLEEIGHHLVDQGLLVRKKKRLYLAIPNGEYPDGNFSVKFSLKKDLREIILARRAPEISEKVLLAFLYRSDLLKLVFTHGERKAAQKRVKKLMIDDEEGNHLGNAFKEILAAVSEVKN